MIVTEQQAQQKWCPFSRVASRGQGGMNRGNLNSLTEEKLDNATACLGSGCMAWVFVESVEHADQVHEGWKRWRFVDSQDPQKEGRKPTNRGFCGLARSA